MTIKQTSFELAPDVLIPQSGSAGDGDPFDFGLTGTGSSFETRNGEPAALANGSVYGVVFTGATAAANCRGWDWNSSIVHARLYIYLDELPTASLDPVQLLSGSSPLTNLARLRFGADGKMRHVNGATASAASTGVLPVLTLVRLECSWNLTAGTFTADAYNAHSTTPISGLSLNLTGLTFAATTATQVRLGLITQHANMRFRTDAWAISDTSRLGPVGSGGGGTTPPPGSASLLSRIVGIPSQTTATVKVRTDSATSVRLKVGSNTAVTADVVFTSAQTPNAQGVTTHSVTGLTAGSTYYYRVEMTDAGGTALDTATTVGRIRTAPTAGAATSFAFCASSCCDATDSASMNAIANRADDLFLHLGDLHYHDGAGTTEAILEGHVTQKLSVANHHRVFATIPTYYTPSDHDAGQNNTNAGNASAAWANWNTVYRRHFPVASSVGNGTTGTYTTFVWGRVRFIVLDRRSFASAPGATDNATKTSLGTVQKTWFKDQITAATEPVIVIVQADPWSGAAAAGDDGWVGYTTERTELANHISASGKNVVMLAGDMHALAADNGNNSPGGIPLFHCSPLNNSASIKGGPYSVDPYPASGSAVVQQYGRVVVTDTGTQISLAFTGYSSDNTQRVALTKTYSVTAPETGGGGGPTAPAAPTGVTATAVSTSQINVAWSAVIGATGYDVERNGSVIATGITGTSYSDTGLAPSTSCTYRVRAYKVA